jgi:hypothetical protein
MAMEAKTLLEATPLGSYSIHIKRDISLNSVRAGSTKSLDSMLDEGILFIYFFYLPQKHVD